MSVNAILNIRTALKRDNIIIHVMIMTVLRSSDNVKFYWHLLGMQWRLYFWKLC